jgi:hypothetical protein
VEAFAAATDTRNNVYVGIYNQAGNASMTFGPGITVSNPGGYSTSLIVKYDSLGNALWAYGTNRSAYIYAITTDSHDNVYMFGCGFDTLTFGATTLTKPGSYFYYFLAKFSSTGTPLWAVNGGSGCPSAIYWYYAAPGGVQTDASDNVYLATTFSDTVAPVGPFLLHNDTTSHTQDILVAKYDSLGNVLWAQRAGGKKSDELRALTVTPNGGVYIAGTFNSPALTFGAITLTGPATGWRMYLAKYDALGTPVWADNFTGYGHAAGLASDSASNVFLTGTFSGGSLSIGSTVITNPTPPNGSCYLVKLDTGNAVVWYKTASALTSSATSDDLWPYGVAVDPCGNAWIEGCMGRNPQINVDGHIIDTPALTGVVYPGQDPCFVAGFNASGAYLGGGALQSGGDDNNGFAVGRNASVYIASESYRGYLIAGADTFYSTGTMEHFYLAKFGYDSIACCHVESIIAEKSKLCVGDTITLSSHVSGGTWSSGAPSIATVGATTGIVTGVAAGTANITYMQPGACQAITTVTVNPVPAPITGPITVFAGATITLADAVAGGSWSSGNPAVATVGSATGIVTGLAPGTVTIYYSLLPGGCATSIVITVKNKNRVGIPSRAEQVVELYPNPVSDELYIVSEAGAYNSFTITNTIGQMVLRRNIIGQQTAVDVKALPPGLYYMSLSGQNGNTLTKFIKK